MQEYARRLATLSPGFSGAEIANLCNEAAILAGREGKAYISNAEFEKASERIRMIGRRWLFMRVVMLYVDGSLKVVLLYSS